MTLKDKIINQSQDLFLHMGFRATTMDDIAAQLGISKKTLYETFDNKSELIYEVITQYLDEAQSSCMEINASSRDALDEVTQMLLFHSDRLKKIRPSSLMELQKFYPEAYQLFLNFTSNFVKNNIKQNIERGQAEGYYRKDANAELLAKHRVEFLTFTLFDMNHNKTVADTLAQNLEVTNNFLLGLMTDKGREVFNNYKIKETHVS